MMVAPVQDAAWARAHVHLLLPIEGMAIGNILPSAAATIGDVAWAWPYVYLLLC